MSAAPPQTGVVLIGYRGSGKTSVGRALAQRLGWAFIDTDDLIESTAGRSTTEIFATEGEEAFREIETRVIAGLSAAPPRVISIGGGAILREENRRRLRTLGVVVWLTAPPETLWARITADTKSKTRRPNLTADGGFDEVRRLLAERSPGYESLATHVLDTASDDLNAVAARIETLIRGNSSINP